MSEILTRLSSTVVTSAQLTSLYRDVKSFGSSLFEAKTLLAICWPSATPKGVPVTFSSYMPDTIQTMTELSLRAADFNCERAFNQFTNNMTSVARGLRAGMLLPIFVILPVRRPLKVIGTESEFEYLSYRLDATTPEMLSNGDCVVSAVGILQPLSQQLLRRTSGVPTTVEGITTAYLGCGSVGSKLAMHLTRAGFCPTLLIDQEELAPHNIARHSLLPRNLTARTKAEELADEIATISSRKPRVLNGNLLQLPADDKKIVEVLSSDNSLLVNSTAGHSVRDFLAGAPLRARILECCLMNQGTTGIVTIEGHNKNPNCTDLMAAAYEVLRRKSSLKQPFNPKELELTIGVGCNSVTLPISDANISIFSAGMAQALLNTQMQGLQMEGRVSVGSLQDDGMSVGWQHESFGPTHLADISGMKGWSVRVLANAHQKILNDIAHYPGVESGGLIVGRCSATDREVIITDILDAPPDSTRAPTLFVLGVQGLNKSITEYNESGASVLWFMGTWHSHLNTGGPSKMDIATALSVERLLKGVVVLLIKRPDGYSAVVRPGHME